MSWNNTATALLPFSAEQLWGTLSDLHNWPKWNPFIYDVALFGPQRQGMHGFYLQANPFVRFLHKRLGDPFIITKSTPYVFELRQGEPVFSNMTIRWTLSDSEYDGYTLFEQEIIITGPSSFVIGPVVGANISANFRRNAAVLGYLSSS